MTQSRPVSHVRYAVLGVTTASAVLLYLDRFCISFTERYIKQELNLSNEQMSWILGSFFFAYALGQVPSGWLADRFGARRTLTAFIMLWSLFTWFTGRAHSFATVFACRILFGLAQAGGYPTSAGLLSRWMPLSRRGVGSSVVAFGGRVGGAIAPILTGYLIVFGWRWVMILYGATGFVVALTYWLIVRDRPSQHPRCSATELAWIGQDASDCGDEPDTPNQLCLKTPEVIPTRTPAPVTMPCLLANARGEGGRRPGERLPNPLPVRNVLASPTIWLSCFSQFMTNVAWVFLATWLPRYLDEVHEVEPTVRGWMAGTPIIIGWFGMLLGGWLTDRLVRVFGLRWGRGLPMSVSRFVAMAAYLICLLQPSPWIATAAFALVAFATDIGIGATWAFLQDVGGRHVGSVLGWTNMWGNFGAALSPWLLNWMIGDSRNWDAAFLTCAGAFLLSGLAALGVDARQRV